MPLSLNSSGAHHAVDVNLNTKELIPHRWVGTLQQNSFPKELPPFPTTPGNDGPITPVQYVPGIKYDWYITPRPLGETYWENGVVAIKKGDTKSEQKILSIIDPTLRSKNPLDLGKEDKFVPPVYPDDQELKFVGNLPTWEQAYKTIPYYAYPLVIPIREELSSKSAKNEYLSNESDNISECLVLIGGMINIGTEEEPIWTCTNYITAFNPTQIYVQNLRTSEDKWRDQSTWNLSINGKSEGLWMSWFTHINSTEESRSLAGGFGGVGINIPIDITNAKTKSKFISIGGLKYEKYRKVFWCPSPEWYTTGNYKTEYCNEIEVILEPLSVYEIDPAGQNVRRKSTVLSPKFNHLSYRYGLLATDPTLYIGEYDENTGFIKNSSVFNVWPLLFPRVFTITNTGKNPYIILYSSMGYDKTKTKIEIQMFGSDVEVQQSVYLTNYQYFHLSYPINQLYGYPLNLTADLGSLDGCVALHASDGHIYFLGGRQFSNFKNKNAAELTALYTGKTKSYQTITYGEENLNTQPYGMYISSSTIGRKSKANKYGLSTYDFVTDTLPYACLYSDALKFPDKDIWLIPSTSIKPTEKNEPPMIIAELLPENWGLSKEELESIKNDKTRFFYENSRFRFTVLEDINGLNYIDALYMSANIETFDLSSTANGIGRGLGDHGIIKVGEDKYKYYNLVSKITIDIEMKPGILTNIHGYVTSQENNRNIITTFTLDTKIEEL
jgi:hypothetical protein